VNFPPTPTPVGTAGAALPHSPSGGPGSPASAAWNLHLENLRLRKELGRAGNEVRRQRNRADLWKARALRRPR